MKKILWASCLLSGLFFWTLPSLAQEPTPTPVTQTRELFNGKDLTNWYPFVQNRGRDQDVNGVFTVVDGMIRISGQDYGCITTNEAFENYKLTVEFRWGNVTWGNRKDKARDSGVLIHSIGPDGVYGGSWMVSVEANLVEGGIGDFWIVGGSTDGVQGTCKVVKTEADGQRFDPVAGVPVTFNDNSQGCFQWIRRDPNWQDVLGFRGANDIDLPNDWNKMEIVAEGNTMTVFLNGELINKVTDLKPTCGKIQLQSEGAEIFFRRVTLSPLDK